MGQLVGRVGEEALEAAEESVDVAAFHFLHEAHDFEGGVPLAQVDVVGEEEADEAFLHFLVGESEGVGLEASVVVLYGEVSALVEDGDGVGVHGVDAGEGVGGGHLAGEAVEVVAVALQELDEEGGGAGLEPVTSEIPLGEGVEEAEGVVDVVAVLGEVVAVEPVFEGPGGFFFRHAVGLAEGADVVGEVGAEFLLGDAADVGESVVHGDVHEVVDIAAHAYFAGFGDSGEEGEAEVAVAAFERSVEGFEGVAEGGLEGLVADGLEEGLVVLVDEHDDVSAGFFGGPPDDALEAEGGGCLAGSGAVEGLPGAEGVVEDVVQLGGCVVLLGVEVEVEDGVDGPLLLQPLHGESGEEFLAAREVGLEGGYEEAFPEAAGAAQKVVFAGLYQTVDQPGFVDVDVAAFADFFEALYANGVDSSHDVRVFV